MPLQCPGKRKYISLYKFILERNPKWCWQSPNAHHSTSKPEALLNCPPVQSQLPPPPPVSTRTYVMLVLLKKWVPSLLLSFLYDPEVRTFLTFLMKRGNRKKTRTHLNSNAFEFSPIPLFIRKVTFLLLFFVAIAWRSHHCYQTLWWSTSVGWEQCWCLVWPRRSIYSVRNVWWRYVCVHCSGKSFLVKFSTLKGLCESKVNLILWRAM